MFIISAVLFLALGSCVPAFESRSGIVVTYEQSSDSCGRHGYNFYGEERCGSRGAGGGGCDSRGPKPPAPALPPSPITQPSGSVAGTQDQNPQRSADSSPTGGNGSSHQTSKPQEKSHEVATELNDGQPHGSPESSVKSSNELPQANYVGAAAVTSDYQRVQAKKKMGDEGETKTRRENRQGNEEETQKFVPPPQVTGQDDRYVAPPLRSAASEPEVSRPSDAMASGTNETSSSKESEQRKNGVGHKRHAMMLSTVLSFIIF